MGKKRGPLPNGSRLCAEEIDLGLPYRHLYRKGLLRGKSGVPWDMQWGEQLEGHSLGVGWAALSAPHFHLPSLFANMPHSVDLLRSLIRQLR